MDPMLVAVPLCNTYIFDKYKNKLETKNYIFFLTTNDNNFIDIR